MTRKGNLQYLLACICGLACFGAGELRGFVSVASGKFGNRAIAISSHARKHCVSEYDPKREAEGAPACNGKQGCLYARVVT